MKKKLHGSIIITDRCNARCNMCNVWQYPSEKVREIGLRTIEKLPNMVFTNITGGEPFIRRDLPEIVEILKKKTKRIVISSNGFFTKRTTALFRKYPDIGIRISVEGLQRNNDTIRNIPHGFDRTLRTLLQLREMGIKDIGFGMTIQDTNAKDLVHLYHLAYALGFEFATASLHNSHYFHKLDNKINNVEEVVQEIKKLISIMLKSKKVKEWFRAYFNYGLINYIKGNQRLLPCEMGQDGFFIDPFGDVLICNGMDEKQSLGNLNEQSWDDIWNGKRAQGVRSMVHDCPKNCWMVGSVAPAILHHPVKPIMWVLENKIKTILRKPLPLM